MFQQILLLFNLILTAFKNQDNNDEINNCEKTIKSLERLVVNMMHERPGEKADSYLKDRHKRDLNNVEQQLARAINRKEKLCLEKQHKN